MKLMEEMWSWIRKIGLERRAPWLALLLVWTSSFVGAQGVPRPSAPGVLPTHDQVTEALRAVVGAGNNGGLGLQVWATIVDRDGTARVITFSGMNRGDQFPASRVLSAEKANTANGFSLPVLALSSGNLFSAVQPGVNAFGLGSSNPIDASRAYRGAPLRFGTRIDPALGVRLGGTTTIAGGLALYDLAMRPIGALGISGEGNGCSDHIIAWKVRDALGLDNLPAGASPTGDDNLIFDIANGVSASGFGYPECAAATTQIGNALPTTNPIGGN